MTFEEAYEVLYKKHSIVRWDSYAGQLKVSDITTISTWELFALIDGLKETYAPKIKMTLEQRDKLVLFIYEDENFEDFWYCYGRGCKLYKEFTEEELMRAWLHPELIEVTDDI